MQSICKVPETTLEIPPTFGDADDLSRWEVKVGLDQGTVCITAERLLPSTHPACSCGAR